MIYEHRSELVDWEEFNVYHQFMRSLHVTTLTPRKTPLCNWYWLLWDYNELQDEQNRIEYHCRIGQCPKDRSEEDVRAVLRHLDRGVPYYPECAHAELLRFAQDRLLIRTNDLSKADLVDLLTEADGQIDFPRFTELPPEVRASVYTTYFKSLPHGLIAPAQPPLALTSSLLRKESLPLFYSTCTFLIPLFCGGVEGTAGREMIGPDDTLPGESLEEALERLLDGSHYCEIGDHRVFQDFAYNGEYTDVDGPFTRAVLRNEVVRWFNKIYRKYAREIGTMTISLPHACLDVYMGFDKKKNRLTFHYHGHCQEWHAPDCPMSEITEMYDNVLGEIKEGKCLSMEVLNHLWTMLDVLLTHREDMWDEITDGTEEVDLSGDDIKDEGSQIVAGGKDEACVATNKTGASH